ncbi:MAG: SGNH/GDSL hydrolase family protein [Proteobacteria bacterium]|nr:SGNH/GDSL hydrolase family protein [Pseudomonadota bacterium]
MPTVLLYGDSNTFGTPPMASLGEDRRFDAATRWPGVVRAALGPEVTVIAEGHPGRTTVHDDPVEGAHRNGLTILPAIIESHRPVDLAVLMLGTNDHKNRFALNGFDIASGALRLIEEMQASRHVKRILWICPPPPLERGCLAEMFEGAEARGRSVAGHMKAMAAELGVSFIDAGEIIAVDPLDGVHLNESAHATLGSAVAARLKEMLKA